jgi:hypothetical protein
VHALLERGNQAEKIKVCVLYFSRNARRGWDGACLTDDSVLIQGALHACESHLDDLEEWLSVFSAKLSNMRHDIHAIEERNNDLETSSRNNAILIEVRGLFLSCCKLNFLHTFPWHWYVILIVYPAARRFSRSSQPWSHSQKAWRRECKTVLSPRKMG